MFVSINWIKEYVELDGLNIEELIERFTLSTAEVEDIIYKGKDIQKVVIARIDEVAAHPDSQKLHLLKLSDGTNTYRCVCGAPNVAEGQKVAFAKSGGRLPGGEIKTAKVAGYESEGMCCSEAELGISEDHSGLMAIDDGAALGADLCDIYPLRDIVFEVDNKSLTNRPDLWGHYGIAREIAAISGRPLKPLKLSGEEFDGSEKIEVEIKRPELAYRYSCLKIQNINRTVSPVYMKIRLTYCGMRPINLLADLTNYLMLELGQPMHAFDARKIDRIVVDTPQENDVFTTLDEVERAIDANTLMIQNGEKPVAIAGIMGGFDSEIVGATTSVLLESANFDGIAVRKTSTRLGLRTDASMRYEKVLDPELTVTAIRRFVALLCEIDPGAAVCSALTDVYVHRFPMVEIAFDKAYVDRYTGIDISVDRICDTLTSLGFSVSMPDEKTFSVTVPSWRATKDVTLKADIIEEITRIYGYDNFAISSTRSLLKPQVRGTAKREETEAKEILVQKFGLHEVHSYLWCDGKKYKRLGIEVEENVRILNIATPENGTLRTSMMPTLLTFAYENRAFAPAFGLFEIGRVVEGVDGDGRCQERRKLCITLFDKESGEKELYFRAVGIVRTLFDLLKHTQPTFSRRTPDYSWQHPKNTSEIRLGDSACGVLCTLHPANLAKIDKNAAVVCVELDLGAAGAVEEKSIAFREPSKFPAIEMDLSLVVGEDTVFADLEKVWAGKIPELVQVKVIDVYEMETGKSITVRFSFVSSEKTLSMEEVQQSTDRIVAGLNKMGIYLRV